MNAGVSTMPCGVSSRPTRAVEASSWARVVNRTGRSRRLRPEVWEHVVKRRTPPESNNSGPGCVPRSSRLAGKQVDDGEGADSLPLDHQLDLVLLPENDRWRIHSPGRSGVDL